MKTITLNNGVEMPLQGFGVFQIAPQDCETAVRGARVDWLVKSCFS